MDGQRKARDDSLRQYLLRGTQFINATRCCLVYFVTDMFSGAGKLATHDTEALAGNFTVPRNCPIVTPQLLVILNGYIACTVVPAFEIGMGRLQ